MSTIIEILSLFVLLAACAVGTAMLYSELARRAAPKRAVIPVRRNPVRGDSGQRAKRKAY